MRWLKGRGNGIPDEAVQALGLQPGERVLVTAQAVDGSWVAATDRALVTPVWRSDWVDIGFAQWEPDDGALVVVGVPGAFGTRRIPLDEPGRLPETVHERVMASIVVTRRFRVPDTQLWVRVVGRRLPDDSLRWQVVPDEGVDPNSPVVLDLADALIRRLRSEVGEVG